jgi:prepilin-type processing-associated H-X9-DG protein
MIFTTQPYDPTEDDARVRSSHFTKKDLAKFLILIPIIVLALWPLWLRLKEQRDKHVCKDNLAQISRALFLYAENNSGRLPPTYVWGENAEPKMFNGRANTWMSLIAEGVKDPASAFTCPSAKATELAPNAIPDGKTAMSAYGMFAALSAAGTDSVPNPSTQAMIGETASMGAEDTYNPWPLKDEDGRLVHDGYVIGFDNSNFLPLDSDMQVFGKSKFATRLAFYGSKGGQFTDQQKGRHEGGIHIVFLDGHVETLPAKSAHIRRIAKEGSEITGAWQIR